MKRTAILIGLVLVFFPSQAGADRKPLPKEVVFDTPKDFGDSLYAFCDGTNRVYLTAEDHYASPDVFVVKDDRACSK